jgi:hypothetical protein
MLIEKTHKAPIFHFIYLIRESFRLNRDLFSLRFSPPKHVHIYLHRVRLQVVTWLGGIDVNGTTHGKLDEEATEGLLAESRALRSELQGLLNASQNMEDEIFLRRRGSNW